ncbi:MAG TPA: cytochrome P450 [Blastocatellia bacterium]|nr:cytochrome P450 [Blastocatellia bacterium]
MGQFSLDPIAAVTHPDPYPYYAALTSSRPLYYDRARGLWVAASAETVTSVLTNELCRVRPPAEPVPRALLGSPAAEIFRHLVRMNDGGRHHELKRAILLALSSVDQVQVAEETARWTRFHLDGLGPEDVLRRLSDFIFHLPVSVMGGLLGMPPTLLPQTALWMSEFVRCLAPASSSEQLERGKLAAGQLFEMFQSLLIRGSAGGLLATLNRELGCPEPEEIAVVAANGIGFISQAYEATAGLIGNTLLALVAYPEVRQQLRDDPALLRLAIPEVLRYDSPVQNTRRFLARDGLVAGREMKGGEAILVLLAAANRDPAANPDPARFDLFRRERRIFTFGLGAHACPGEMFAATIAETVVRLLIGSGLDLDRLTATYRASANLRIPLFTAPESAGHRNQPGRSQNQEQKL